MIRFTVIAATASLAIATTLPVAAAAGGPGPAESRFRIEVSDGAAVIVGETITARVVIEATVPTSGAQVSLRFNPLAVQLAQVSAGAAYADAPISAGASPAAISAANKHGFLPAVAAAFIPPHQIPPGPVEFLVVRFRVIGCGRSEIGLGAGSLGAALLDGRAATYGESLAVATAPTDVLDTPCAPGMTPVPAPPSEGAAGHLQSASPAAPGGGSAVTGASCPISVLLKGNMAILTIMAQVEPAFESFWQPGTAFTSVLSDTTQAIADLRGGIVTAAGADRPLDPEEAADVHYWQFALFGETSYHVAVRKVGLANRIDDSALVRGDDLVNYLLSGVGQAAVSAAGYETVPPADTPPIPDWDIDLNGVVSLSDIGVLTGRWGQVSVCPGWIRADATNDGVVALADIGVVTGKWGQVGFQAPSPVPTCEGAYRNRHLGWVEGGVKWGARAHLANGPLNICGNPTPVTIAGSQAWVNIQGGNGQNSIVQVGVARCRKPFSGECDGARKVVFAWGREAGDWACGLQMPFPQEIEVWDGSPAEAKVQREGANWILYWDGIPRIAIPYSYTACSWTPASAAYFTETWNDGDYNGGTFYAKYEIGQMAFEDTIGGRYTSVSTNECNLKVQFEEDKYFCTASGDDARTWTVP